MLKCYYYFPISGLKIPFPVRDKEFNKVAALFNILTFLLTCTALVLPTWFKIKGLHCAQESLTLFQYISFDDSNDDDDDEITIRQDGKIFFS